MASSAPKVAEEERYEAFEVVDQKAQALADQIKKSKHFIAFTGAGVSTSTGIPDFRGPEGAWTLRAQGRQRTSKAISTLQAIPSPTHMALVGLQNRGLLKFLVSQNCDGLHRRSGILPDRISELHGNSNLEYCKDCGKEYLRGRKCPCCNGILLDSIINFTEPLPPKHVERAFDNAKEADLCLVLGSSLMVTPANEIPEVVSRKRNAKLVICNLQQTPLDALSDLRIYSKTDDLMIRVMEKLDIPIPPFILYRRLVVQLETMEDTKHRVTVSGVDIDGTPVTFLRSVKVEYNRRAACSEPFVMNFRENLDSGTNLKLELEFMGHYGEPNVDISYEYTNESNTQAVYLLEYNPYTREWKVGKQTE
ncbi:hypothetical protein B7463_g2209, partial [Scytalidium lignicola]